MQSKLFLKTFFVLIVLLFVSCKEAPIKNNNNQFRIGTFEIPAGKNFVKETIIRKDSLQISTYGNQIDSMSIHWKNNFFYTLKYLHPKNELQKDPMYVQINKVYKNSYDFTVKIGFSSFLTKGTIHKIK